MVAPLWLQILLVIVATCQITETFRHGSIFAPVRAWVESRGEFWAELIGCGFCFSHWAAAMAVLLLIGHQIFAFYEYSVDPCLLTLVWLTAIRGANLLNDYTKSRSKTPPADALNLDDLELTEESENGSGTDDDPALG